MQKTIKEKGCESCNNCGHALDGDLVCFANEYEYTHVLYENGPTDNYLICNGEHFTPRVNKKRNRKSIVTPCMDCCYICGTTRDIHIHHIYGGPNRNNSENYGLIIPLCADHHNMSPDSAHLNPEINIRLKVIGQEVFETKVGTREEFIQIFGKSYILD